MTLTRVTFRLRKVPDFFALGNAIVPQVAAEIIRCMIQVDAMTNSLPPGSIQ